MAGCENKAIVFKMIPKESDILSESNIIDGVDLVQIDLKVNNFFNKLTKRAVDFSLSLFLLVFLMPLKIFLNGDKSALKNFIGSLQRIFKGEISFVGRTEIDDVTISRICKVGLTSLAKLNLNENSTREELQRLDFLYAKNQTFFLDCEILINSIIEFYRKRNNNNAG